MLSPISVPAAEAWPPDLIISTASLPPHKKQPRVAAPPKDQGFTFPCGLSLAYGAQHELAWQLKIRHTTTTLGRPPIWGVPKPNVPAPPAIIHLPKPVITKHNKRSRTCWFLPLPRVHASCTPSHLLGLGSRIPMHALASGRTAPVRPRRTSPSNAPVPISTRDSTAPRDLLTALLAPPLHPPPLAPVCASTTHPQRGFDQPTHACNHFWSVAAVRPRRTNPSNTICPISTRDSTARRDLLASYLGGNTLSQLEHSGAGHNLLRVTSPLPYQ